MSCAARALPELATPEELLWLDRMCEANRYLCPQPMGGGRYAVLSRFAFTCAIITGDIGDEWGYSNRWCFDGFDLAAKALLDWRERGFEGEPQGWHRHPDTGRRRPDGDASKEYINL